MDSSLLAGLYRDLALNTARAGAIAGGPGSDTLFGANGNDIIKGFGADDFLSGQDGADSLYGGAGNDYLKGDGGDDYVDGGDGYDRAGFQGAAGPVHVSLLLQGQAQDTGQGMDTLVGIEHLSGTNFDGDVLTGDEGDNWLWGGAGSDLLNGGGGDDLLEIGSGASTVVGGTGLDTVSLLGNTVDTLGGVLVDLRVQGHAQDTGQGLIVLKSIENASGSIHDDHLVGSNGANVLAGVHGDDTIEGGGGADLLLGDGSIIADHQGLGLSGQLTIFYQDPLSAGDDVIEGGGGIDTLVGGVGADTLTGGGGNDIFFFRSIDDSPAGGAWDLITDLGKKETIDLSRIDADTTQDGDQAFEVVKKLTGHAGQAALVYDKGAGVTNLQLDVDGDGQADAVIQLTGNWRAYDHFVL